MTAPLASCPAAAPKPPGLRTALYAGLDLVGPLYARKTEFDQKLRDIVASEGVPAAVRWRSAQFCKS